MAELCCSVCRRNWPSEHHADGDLLGAIGLLGLVRVAHWTECHPVGQNCYVNILNSCDLLAGDKGDI